MSKEKWMGMCEQLHKYGVKFQYKDARSAWNSSWSTLVKPDFDRRLVFFRIPRQPIPEDIEYKNEWLWEWSGKGLKFKVGEDGYYIAEQDVENLERRVKQIQEMDEETISKMAEGPKEETPSTKEENIERSNN